jgi:hypothetical protein
MKKTKAITASESLIPEMNQYRLTFRNRDGVLSQCGVTAPTIRLAVQGNNDPCDLVKVERIDPVTGAVLGGLYNE